MSEGRKTGPSMGARAAAAQAERAGREAAALRENLRRRKAQARAREEGGAGVENGETEAATRPEIS